MFCYAGRFKTTVLVLFGLSAIHFNTISVAHAGPLFDRLTQCAKTEGVRMLQEQPLRLLASRLRASEILGIIGTAYLSAKSAANHENRQLANQALVDGIKLYIEREHPKLARLVDFGRFGLCMLGHRRRAASNIRPARSSPRRAVSSRSRPIRSARSRATPRQDPAHTPPKHRSEKPAQTPVGTKGMSTTMPTSGYWVQFGAFKSQARAEQQARKIRHHKWRFAKQRIRMVSVRTKSQKRVTRILLGPFDNKPNAKKLCADMKAHKFNCFAASSRRR